MCKDVALQPLAKKKLRQTKNGEQGRWEFTCVNDRAQVANILTYPRKRCERGTREAEIVSDEEWSKEVEGAYLHM